MNGLKIEDGIFVKMREDFNDILDGTVRELITKGGSDATLRVGLSISLDRQRVFDSGNPQGREVIIPRLQYSIKTVMQKKAELKGELEHDYQLSLGDSGRLEVLESDRRLCIDEHESSSEARAERR